MRADNPVLGYVSVIDERLKRVALTKKEIGQIEKRGEKLFAKANIRLGEMAHVAKEVPLTGNMAYLQITSDKDYYYLNVSNDGSNYETLAKMDYRYLSTEVIGGFTGVMLGVFAQTDDNKEGGFVDVDWFEYKK